MANNADFEKDKKRFQNKLWKLVPVKIRPLVIAVVTITVILVTLISILSFFGINLSIGNNLENKVLEQSVFTEEDYTNSNNVFNNSEYISVAVCREIDSDWSNTTYIRNNELAKCRITLTNKNNFIVNNSVISCVLSRNLEIVDSLGMTIFRNEYPEGLHDDVSGLVSSGVSIQSISPNESIYLTFYLKAISEDIEREESITGVVNINGNKYQEGAAIKIENPMGGWGDNLNGRKDYTIEQINNDALGDIITFNSISDSTIGHEFNFVGARKNGENGLWNANVREVEDGEEYVIRLFVHNNSPKGYDAIAKGVKTTFSLPTTISKEHTIVGYLDSSNAVPNRYWDGVTLKCKDYFYIEYLDGSALLENNSIGKNGGIVLSDDIIHDGVEIGYNALDGQIPGCYQYSCYVTINVKVHVIR